jgi:hypothetical protein
MSFNRSLLLAGAWLALKVYLLQRLQSFAQHRWRWTRRFGWRCGVGASLWNPNSSVKFSTCKGIKNE